MVFSVKVKQLREQLFLTQDELAKILNVSFATINRWEKDKYEPSMKHKKVFYQFCAENNVIFNERG